VTYFVLPYTAPGSKVLSPSRNSRLTAPAFPNDPDPYRVLVAVDAHLDDALPVARRFAFAPEAPSGTAEVPRFARRDGLLQCLRVHVGDHQHVARSRIGHHAGDEPIGIELRCEGATFLDLLGRPALGER